MSKEVVGRDSGAASADVESTMRLVAAFGAANDAVDAAAAEALGINRTDLAILGEIFERGTMSAGQAAEAIAMSASATTTAIQRLVRTGLVSRTEDPSDRRRARLELTPVGQERIARIYGPLAEDGRAVLVHLSPNELAVIDQFLSAGIDRQRTQAARIRDLAANGG